MVISIEDKGMYKTIIWLNKLISDSEKFSENSFY
jgi:hypothetical protein